MLALIYLGIGDCCRRSHLSALLSVCVRPAPLGGSLLVGMLLSTWLTYLAGLAFAHTAEPLLSADLPVFRACARRNLLAF